MIKAYKQHCSGSVFNKLTPKNGYHFTNGFNIEKLDAFRIGHFDKSFYVSERLKNIWETHNITGLEFTETQLFNTKSITETKTKKYRLSGS